MKYELNWHTHLIVSPADRRAQGIAPRHHCVVHLYDARLVWDLLSVWLHIHVGTQNGMERMFFEKLSLSVIITSENHV